MSKNWYVVTREVWAVCGGRDFDTYDVVESVLDHVVKMRGVPCLLVTGGCPTGADYRAGQWAKQMHIPLICVEPDWARHGRSAGPIRNRQILAIHNPDILIAFPGGKGTADMVHAAETHQAIEILTVEQRDARD